MNRRNVIKAALGLPFIPILALKASTFVEEEVLVYPYENQYNYLMGLAEMQVWDEFREYGPKYMELRDAWELDNKGRLVRWGDSPYVYRL